MVIIQGTKSRTQNRFFPYLMRGKGYGEAPLYLCADIPKTPDPLFVKGKSNQFSLEIRFI